MKDVGPSVGNGRPLVQRFRLLTDTALAALPPLTWAIAGLLPDNGLSVLYGPPGSYKSFLALSWDMAIAQGVPWIGRETRHGSVVHVAGEGAHGLGQRIQAYREAHEVAGAVDVFFVVEPVNLLEVGDVGGFLQALDVQLTTLMLEDPAEKRVNPQLVVFDTMARAMPGGDENSARDVGLVIAAADRIRREADCGVLIVHHTQKAGELERGSSALRGAADAMFFLRPEDEHLLLECTKQKDGPAADPIRLRAVKVGPSLVIQPDEGQPSVGVLPTHKKLLDTMFSVSQDGETSAQILIDCSGLSKAAVYRSLRPMLDLHYISKRGSRYALTTYGESLVSRSLT